MRICIVSCGYPSKECLTYPFVQQLSHELVRQGHAVTLIVPQSIVNIYIRRNKKIAYHTSEIVSNSTINIYRPLYVSAGNILPEFGYWSMAQVIEKEFAKIKDEIDVCYGHFWHAAYCFYPAAKKYNKPLFVANGESNIELSKVVSLGKLSPFISYVHGVVCVSTKCKQESVKEGLAQDYKCKVFPNAIDRDTFNVLDKNSIRKDLGIKEDDFIVTFVGGFFKRKGPKRVSDAIKLIGDSKIKAIFVGYTTEYDTEIPSSENAIFCGGLKHEDVPKYLNAADVFVLPTLHEGCCNSIVEAMACGLPIISSDRSFNYDILNEENSILIDPMDIEAIAAAIKKLKDNPDLRKSMSKAALQTASRLTINERVSAIVDFIEERR